MVIRNGLVYQEDAGFKQKDIFIQNGFFSEMEEASQIVDATGLYVIPGLVDIHFHGCAGYDFCDGTIEAIKAIAAYEAMEGITAIVPATMTLGDEELERIFTEADTYGKEVSNDNLNYIVSAMPTAVDIAETKSSTNYLTIPKKSFEGCADFAGINMEGPYISKKKKGAQNEAFIRKPDSTHFRRMNKLSGNRIKLVSLAPEEEGAMEFIEELKDEVNISIAHTTAGYETTACAFCKGARHVTHLYNAMNPFSHREPGVVGAACEKENVMVELICDGVHIAPAAIRATFKMFGADRIVLVSDSMMATGLTDGTYALGGQEVTVTGNLATLSDGTIAGSVTNLMQCMKRAVSFGIRLEDAVKCASENPAKTAGIYDRYGSITKGKAANFVLLDQELNVVSVYLHGKKIK